MHLTTTMKHWSHHLHDDLFSLWHGVDRQFHSARFWIGAGVVILIGLMTLLLILAWHTPVDSFDGFEYSYPFMYYQV